MGMGNPIMKKMKKINDWLDKGDGGEWYEPYVTNRDMIFIQKTYLILA